MSTGRSGGPDEDLRRWLAARIDEESARPDEHTPTAPHRAVRPALGSRPPAWAAPPRPGAEDDEGDPATEVMDGSLEDERDPRTVRVHRLPLSFIGESVFDPETARSADWSAPEGPVDEVPLRARTPTPPPAPSARRAFRPPTPPAPPVARATPALEAPAPDIGARHVLGAVAVGAVLGLLGAGLVLWVAS